MTFLDRLSKSVQKGAAQAKFEADKLLRQNKVSSEVSSLAATLEKAVHTIGTKVVEMHSAGGIDATVLETMVAEVKGLEAQIAAKKAELEAIKAEQFVEPEPGEATAPEATSGPLNCANCGASLSPGAKFCPSCGNKVE